MVDLLRFRFRYRVYNLVFLYFLIGDRSQQLYKSDAQQDGHDNQVRGEKIRWVVQPPVVKDVSNIVARERGHIRGPAWY